MPVPTERLLDVEANLDRSFAATVLAFVVAAMWPVALRAMTLDDQPWTGPSWLALGIVAVALYLWFAYAAMTAAGCVGRSKGLIGTWIILAPVIGAVLPIPLVSLAIQVSPLSLKFILASEIRSEIHDQTFAE
jgi:hypothetical protein